MLPATARLMSADDHIIEPPDLWVDRVPARFRADCPRIVEVDGRQAWSWQDELTYIPMGSCRPLPGFDEAGYPPAPGTARFDEIRPGCYDPVERIKDMDVDGVWGQLCFPNFARFAGHRFYLDVDRHRARARLPPHLQRLPARRVVRDGTVAVVRRGHPPAARHRRQPSPSSSASSRRAPRRSRSPRTRPCSGCRRSTPTTGIRSGRSPTRPRCRCACTSGARRAW